MGVRRRRFIPINVPAPRAVRHYNFKAGINTLTANEQLPPESSPYLRNVRYNSRETFKTRQGPGRYSDAIDQALDQSHTGAETTSGTISTTVKHAAPFTAGVSQLAVRVDVDLKQGSPAGTGPILVEIWSDSGGSPSTMLAQASIGSGSVTSSYQYLSTYFLNPASLTSGTKYWVVSYVQTGGTNSYLWGATAGSTAKSSTGGASWAAQSYDLNFKVYMAPNNPILGGIQYRKNDGTRQTLIANNQGVYTVNDSTGAVTQIFAGSSTATNYVFEQVNDYVYWVNGVDSPRKWDGSVVSAVTGAPIASYIKLHKNILFLVDAADTTKVVYSDLGAYDTYTSANFFYVPAPKTADPIYKLSVLNDNLMIRTRDTKWVLYGSDSSSFILRRSTALQGLVSPNAASTHDNFEYAVAYNGVYSFNGSTDTMISEPIQPDFDAIASKNKIATVISGNYLRIYYPQVGQTYNSMALIYDLHFGIWFIDDAAYFSGGFTMRNSSNQELLVLGSSRVGQVFYADQAYSDLGAPIAMDYRTKYDSFESPETIKLIRRFFPKFVGQDGNYTCDIYVDFDKTGAPNLVSGVNVQRGGVRWGSFIWGAAVWGGYNNIEPELEVEGEFRTRQYRFQHTGVDEPVEVFGYTDYFTQQRSL